MTLKSNLEWKKWGEIDPLFGVATWSGKSKTGPHPWQDEEFYALGESDWRDFKKHWMLYGVTLGDCLEIGCGAGRITKQLAADFTLVKALDISNEMIEYAKKNISRPNVEFHCFDGGSLPFSDSSIDAVFSTHVFQHLDSIEDAANYFREIYRILTTKGSFMIHLPIYRWPGHPSIYRTLRKGILTIQNIFAAYYRLRISQGHWKPFMRFHYFEMDWLYRRLDEIGFEDVEIRIIRVKSNNDPHPFVFARKP